MASIAPATLQKVITDVIAGLDLGQAGDYTCLTLWERVRIEHKPAGIRTVPPEVLADPAKVAEWLEQDKKPKPKIPPAKWYGKVIMRFDVHTPYPDIVDRVKAGFDLPENAGGTLVIDGTGVGRAVVDMFRRGLTGTPMCEKCKGTGKNRIRRARTALLVFEPQNLEATVATIKQLTNVKVVGTREDIDQEGRPSRIAGIGYQGIQVEGDVGFAEYAMRNQGYARWVNTVEPEDDPRDFIPCTFCVGGKTLSCRVVPVQITGGHAPAKPDDHGYWNVPKSELIAVTNMLLQTRLVTVDDDVEAGGNLLKELRAFRVKQTKTTGAETFEAWRERDHDDMVLASALAFWYGERARKQFWVRQETVSLFGRVGVY